MSNQGKKMPFQNSRSNFPFDEHLNYRRQSSENSFKSVSDKSTFYRRQRSEYTQNGSYNNNSQGEDFVMTINSYRIITEKLEKECHEKHNKFHKSIVKDIKEVESSAERKILANHLKIIEQQTRTFSDSILNIKNKYIEICSPGYNKDNSIKNSCEKILKEAKNESWMFKQLVPIYAYKNQILSSFKENQVTILSVDTCYSASEVIPFYICQICDDIVISCAPSSLGTVSSVEMCKAFKYMPEQNIVGYETDIYCEKSQDTRIIFMPASILYTKISQKSFLNDHLVVILQCDLKRSIEMEFLLHRLLICLKQNPRFKLILLLSPLDDILKYDSYFNFTTVNIIKTLNTIFPVKTVWKQAFISESNCITAIVNTALAIHTFNEPGDVLVFLPFSLDCKELVNVLKYKFMEHNFHRETQVKYICEQSLEKSDLLFLKPSKDRTTRNYFLIAPECFAEFIPMQSVAYTIDPGIQGFYSSEKSSDVLNQKFISQTRAKLRKQCVGRYNAGICYRLFSKHDYANKMTLSELPEILQDDSFDVVIKILQYNFKNAIPLQLFDSLAEDDIKKIVSLLKNVGVIEGNRFTLIGKEIIKLPYLPQYSKMIILGIEWGYTLESIVLVAMFMVNKSMFLCDDKDMQHKVDKIKFQYFVFNSDTLTDLEVYRRWDEIDSDCQEHWCNERGIDYHVLIEIQRKISDIKKVVIKQLHPSEINSKISLQQSDNCKVILEMIYNSFKDNLCVYTGHYRSGYYFLNNADQIVFLHPSSYLFQLCEKNPRFSLPEFVVFHHLQTSSKTFMIGVTGIPRDLVFKYTERKSFCEKVEALLKNKLTCRVIEGIGVSVIKQMILGAKGKKLTEIEAQIKQRTNCNHIVIEPSEEKGSITIHTPSEFINEVEVMFREILQVYSSSVLNAKGTFILDLEKGFSTVPVAITVMKGAITCELNLSKVNDNKTSSATQELKSDDEESSMKYCIDLIWLRRECRGYGFVSFKSEDFHIARLLCSTTPLFVNGQKVDIQLSKHLSNQLHIIGLSERTTDEDLTKAVNIALQKHSNVYKLSEPIELESAYVVCSSSYKTTEEEIRHIHDEIYTVCQTRLQGNHNFSVTVSKPENNDKFFKATINMYTPEVLDQVAVLLSDMLKINDFPVKAEPVYHCTMTCNIKVFKALQKKIDVELTDLDKNLRYRNNLGNDIELFKFHVNVVDYEIASLKVSTNYQDIMNILQRIIYKILEGEIITSNHFPKLHRVFNYGGHLFLRALEEEMNICIIDESKSEILRLYGTRERCQIAITRIEDFLINTENEIVTKIDLSTISQIRVLLKEVIRKYGIDLKKFIEEFKLRSADVNIREAKLIFRGDQQHSEEACQALEKLAANISPAVEKQFVSFKEICSICLELPLKTSIRLEQCSHLYCSECLKAYINTTKFPVLCGVMECKKELILDDIHKAFDYNEDEMKEFLKKSLENYVAQNKNRYLYCVTPDCSMIFDKQEVASSGNSKWHCKLCQNDICVKCNVVYHNGYTCEIYQGTLKDPDYGLKAWMVNNKENRKQCPKCSTAIEKNLGCNHMTCKNCGTHFCWNCRFIGADGDAIYNHQRNCPGHRM